MRNLIYWFYKDLDSAVLCMATSNSEGGICS